MTRNSISIEKKKDVMRLYDLGICHGEIGKILGINEKTVSSIIYRAKKNKVLCKPRGHRHRILTAEHIERIRGWVDDDCTVTLSSLQDKIREMFDIEVSTTTIHRNLDNLHYSLKRTVISP